MTHTPGPWAVRATDNYTSIVGNETVDVAAIPDPSEPEQQANARLIAAAPELLEALKATKRQLESTRLSLHTSLCQEYESCTDSCTEALQQGIQARAAIEKAKPIT